MRGIAGRFLVFGFALFAVIQLSSVIALADVNIFAEGAYTTDELVVYIYADTTVNMPTELRSAGVKLTYDMDELTLTSCEKNDTDWFLGSESYMEPDTSTAGEAIIILGKLDTDNTSTGVSGDRVLLGKASFTHSGLTSFTLGLNYGKRGDETPPGSGIYSFKNFVDTKTPANALDDTASMLFGTIIVAERGDANADGSINISDVTEIRRMVFNEIPKTCYADCDENSEVNISDVTCIRNKVFQ